MKLNLLISLLLIIFFLPLNGQTDSIDIKTTLEEYFKTVEDRNYSETVEYLYPALFEHFPKEMMIQGMEQSTKDTVVSVSVANAKLISVSESIVVDSIRYALIEFSFDMSMQFLETEEEQAMEEGDEELDLSVASFTYDILKGLYGEENTKLDRENERIDIFIVDGMYAIFNPEYGSWKFLKKEENMNHIIEQILPKKVLKNL